MPLPFPAVLVASRNDPYATLERSGALARLWSARLVDAGNVGHLNADSELGAWEAGQSLAEELLRADGGSLSR